MNANLTLVQAPLARLVIAGFSLGLYCCNAQLQLPCESGVCLPATLSISTVEPQSASVALTPECDGIADSGVRMAAAWRNSTDAIDVNLSWMLPSGGFARVESSGWEYEGLETVTEDSSAIPEGIHWLSVGLPGAGVFTDLDYHVSFINSEFCYSGRESSPKQNGIAIDVLHGKSTILFNGWTDGASLQRGGPTGNHAVEFQVGVRDATDDVDLQIAMKLPSGATAPGFHQGWGRVGFERIAVERLDALEDGTYELTAFLNGTGATAQVVVDIRFGDVRIHDLKYVGSGWSLTSIIDVQNGVASQTASSDD